MKAHIIKPESQTIETIDVNNKDDIVRLIGFDTIIADGIGEGDNLYFDEECFLRGSSGRFQIDTLVPVSGIGVIAGSSDEKLADVEISIDALRSRIKFL